jgi:transposase-like protein
MYHGHRFPSDDQDDDTIDILVQKRRNKRAAKRSVFSQCMG